MCSVYAGRVDFDMPLRLVGDYYSMRQAYTLFVLQRKPIIELTYYVSSFRYISMHLAWCTTKHKTTNAHIHIINIYFIKTILVVESI